MFGHSSLRGNELRRKVYLASFCQCFTRDLFMQNPLSCFIPIKRHCSDHSQSLIKSRVLVIASKTARDFDQVVWPWFWKEAFWRNIDRKSTRLNSSHLGISYAVFCLKK